MNLKDKQLYRYIFELIFQNPEAAKEVFTFVLDNIDSKVNGFMVEVLPLLNYVTTSNPFDVKLAYKVGLENIKEESLLKIFNVAVSNNTTLLTKENMKNYFPPVIFHDKFDSYLCDCWRKGWKMKKIIENWEHDVKEYYVQERFTAVVESYLSAKFKED